MRAPRGLRAGAAALAVAAVVVGAAILAPPRAPAAAGTLTAQEPSSDGDRVVPDPVLVEERDDLPRALVLDPPIARIEVGDRGERVRHEVRHGLDGRVDLALAVTTIDPAADGSPRPGEPLGAEVLRLPADQVVLDPGEVAHVTSAAAPDATGALAVTATPAGADPLVAYVLLVPEGHTDRVDAAVTITDRQRVRLTATARGAPTLATSSLEVRGPFGLVLAREALEPVVLLTETPRALDWSLGLPPVPFPVTVVVTVEPSDGPPVEATASIGVGWAPLTAIAVAVILVLTLLVAARRRHRRRATAGVIVSEDADLGG